MSSAGEYAQTLNAFDLLGNLIPGLVVVFGLFGFVHRDVPALGVATTGGTLVVAFVLGSFVQRHASLVSGKRETFELTIKAAELPSAESIEQSDHSESSDGSDQPDTANTETTCLRRCANVPVVAPLLDPLFGWAANPRGEKLDDAVLTGRIRQHLFDTHQIPTDFDDFQVLYHLMLSRVDGADTVRRATRAQAVRNFYRGLWVAGWWFGLLVVLTVGINTCVEQVAGCSRWTVGSFR